MQMIEYAEAEKIIRRKDRNWSRGRAVQVAGVNVARAASRMADREIGVPGRWATHTEVYATTPAEALVDVGVDGAAADDGHEDGGFGELGWRNFGEVGGEDDEVGEFAGF